MGHHKATKEGQISIIIICTLIFIIGEAMLSLTIEQQNTILNNAIEVTSDSLKNENEGKIVSVHGRISSVAEFEDPLLGPIPDQLAVVKQLDIYRWYIHENNEGDDTIKKDWGLEVPHVDQRRLPEGSKPNPPGLPDDAKYQSFEKFEDGIMGEYLIPKGVFSLSKGLFEPYIANDKILEVNRGIIIHEDAYYIESDPNAPQIGDIRIKYTSLPEGIYTLVGEQRKNRVFAQWEDNAHVYFRKGELGLEETVGAEVSNLVLTLWITRIVTFTLVYIGFSGLHSLQLRYVSTMKKLIKTAFLFAAGYFIAHKFLWDILIGMDMVMG